MSATTYYQREISLPTSGSLLLFGPRMVGKTTVLGQGPYTASYNLLNPTLELELRSRPDKLLQEISQFPVGGRVFIDEIQRVPELLNIVQIGIDQHQLDFVLSGSSARKLKRGRANLLGGRALDYKLYPLTMKEMGADFDLEKVLQMGSLPKIVTESQLNWARTYDYLDSYVTTYIKEEIQAEALVRNLGSFQRFLSIAAQSNAQTIEFSNISRESSTPSSTVKEYYQILEDTLLGFFLWPYDRKERKKARPKFYFFDPGVVRALQGRLSVDITPSERGMLFETWLINELLRINEYLKKRLEFSFWRERNHEIDLLISRGGKIVAGVEIKSKKAEIPTATKKRFKNRFPNATLYTVMNSSSLNDQRLSYWDFFDWLRAL